MTIRKRLSIAVDADGVLQCPSCGGDYLHHQKMSAYLPRLQGEVMPTHALTFDFRNQDARRELEYDEKPNLSRDGDAGITFCCEHCTDILELTIAQRKGRTFLEWRVIGESFAVRR